MNTQMSRQPEPEVMDIEAEAEAYARADFSEVNQAFADRLVELVGGLERAAAIDLGAGPADITIRVSKARPAWRIKAVDAAPAMLALARKAVDNAGLSGAIELIQADAKDTRLPGQSFDVLFSNSILHHITQVELFWNEVKRLAKPGALVFLRDLARPASPQSARDVVEKYSGSESELLKEEFYRSLLSAYTPEEVRIQLKSAALDWLDVAMVTDRHLDVFGRLEACISA